jgi:hypothetical protein
MFTFIPSLTNSLNIYISESEKNEDCALSTQSENNKGSGGGKKTIFFFYRFFITNIFFYSEAFQCVYFFLFLDFSHVSFWYVRKYLLLFCLSLSDSCDTHFFTIVNIIYVMKSRLIKGSADYS